MEWKFILYVLIGFLVNLVYIMLVSIRYKYLLYALGEKISLLHASCLFCVYQTVTYLDPFKIGGVVVKPLISKALSKTGVRNSFIVTMFEQVFDFTWQIPLLIIVFFIFGRSLFSKIPYTQVIIILAAVAVSLAVVINFQRILDFFLKKIVPRKMKRFSFFNKEEFNGIRKDLLHSFKDKKHIFWILLITLVFALFAPLLITISLMPFGIMISYQQAFIVYWVSLVVGRISGIPGGFVSRDVTLLGMLVYYGLPSAIVLKSIFLYRIITIVPNIAIGGSLLLYYGGKYGIKAFSRKGDC